MRIVMKTHLFAIGVATVLGPCLLSAGYAATNSEYIHLIRHRDSNGNLLMAPKQHQPESAVIQKTMMPSQPKMFERQSTDWGMTAQEVKANEPVQPSWELQSPVLAGYEQRVAYHTQIEGIEAGLTYTFYENRLGQAKYVFEPRHDDPVNYIQDFHQVKNWISESYGSPSLEQEIWLDDLYQYDSSLWGQAIMRGHLVMVAEWEKPGTDIVLVLDGGNDAVGLVADFSSTTVVMPISYDTQSQDEYVEETVKETSVQETVLTPSAEDAMTEEAVFDQSSEDEISSEVSTDTEVAAQTFEEELDDWYEMEEMLMDESEEMWLDEEIDDIPDDAHSGSFQTNPQATETSNHHL